MPTMQEQMRQRTKVFAIRIVNLFRKLSKADEARIIGRQVLRSGTSVAANYRAVNRSRSQAEFVAKMGLVVEETDETLFWLELLIETKIVNAEQMHPLIQEANELLRIFSASLVTARKRKREPVLQSPDHPITRSSDHVASEEQ